LLELMRLKSRAPPAVCPHFESHLVEASGLRWGVKCPMVHSLDFPDAVRRRRWQRDCE